MQGFLIFIIVLVLLWLVWPVVTRTIRTWVMRKLQRRAEDYMRAAAGMPPREETKRARRSAKGTNRQENRAQGASGASRQRRTYRSSDEPLIPKEYAVDVEFTEIKEYSETVTIGPEGQTAETREWHESQVSDVEWTEIKNHAS